ADAVPLVEGIDDDVGEVGGQATVADDAAHADQRAAGLRAEGKDRAGERERDGLGVARLPADRGDQPAVLVHGRTALDELDGSHAADAAGQRSTPAPMLERRGWREASRSGGR